MCSLMRLKQKTRNNKHNIAIFAYYVKENNMDDRLHFNYRCDSQSYINYIDKLYNEISEHYKNTKRFSGNRSDYIKTKKDHLSGITLHLLMSYFNNKNTNYSRRSESYNKPKNAKKTRYKGIAGYSHKYTLAIIDYFEYKEFIINNIGKRYKYESYMSITKKFYDILKSLKMQIPYLHKEFLVLRASKNKDENKSLLEYKDNKLTISIRDNIKLINEKLSKYKLNLRFNENEEKNKELWIKFKKFYYQKYGHSWKDSFLFKNKYLRSFSDNFENGGRWYCVWWQDHCPSDFRRFITIDNEPTVELDFQSIHPSIIYAQSNLDIPKDCYDIPGYSKEDRKIIKSVYMRMLNSYSVEKALCSIRLKFNTGELDYTDNIPSCSNVHLKPIIDALLNKHKLISKFFFTGIGTKIQYYDSELAKNIMMNLFDKGICSLCVHDSFIVQKKYKNELYEVMTYEFEKSFGKKILVK